MYCDLLVLDVLPNNDYPMCGSLPVRLLSGKPLEPQFDMLLLFDGNVLISFRPNKAERKKSDASGYYLDCIKS